MFTVNPLLLLLLAVAGWPARAQLEEEEDQLAVASSLQEAVQPLTAASPLALLIATASGGAAPVLPLAPQHFRPKRKPQKFGESGEEGGRQRFRPRNKKKDETALPPPEEAANEIPRTTVDIAEPAKAPLQPAKSRKEFIPRSIIKKPISGGDVNANAGEPAAAVKVNKFSGFLRRPRPIGSGTAAPTLLPQTGDITATGVATTEESSAGTEVDANRFVEFVPTLPPAPAAAATTTLAPLATTRFQLEDFFGTPESVAASELSAARADSAVGAFSPPLARLVDARGPVGALGSEDISENLILEEVRSRTAAITGAQPVGVSRELSPRREGARQLKLPQQEPAPLAKEPTNESVRTRGDEARKGGGRRTAAAAATKQQQQQVLTPRKEVPAAGSGGGKRGGGRPGKEPVGTVERYRQEHEDGSITWGYENEDGSYKEETIGIDCVTHGKYGYIDPTGEVREYTYTSGSRCDPLTRQVLRGFLQTIVPRIFPTKSPLVI